MPGTRATPYTEAAVTDDYLSNPELGLYMAKHAGTPAPKAAGQTYYGAAVPGLAPLRIQTKSLAGQPWACPPLVSTSATVPPA